MRAENKSDDEERRPEKSEIQFCVAGLKDGSDREGKEKGGGWG